LGPARGLYITKNQYNVFGNDADLKKTSIFIINIITKKLQSIFLKRFHFEIGHLPSRHLKQTGIWWWIQIMSVFFMLGEGRFDWGVMLLF
jgi:hypothetical protein